MTFQHFEEDEETATGHCGKCGHAFKYDPSFEPSCPFCDGKALASDDTDTSGCYYLPFKPL